MGKLIGVGLLILVMDQTERTAWGLEFKGFADVTYSRSTIDPGLSPPNTIDPDERNGTFGLGPFDLFLTQPLENRLEVLSELVVESDRTGDSFIDLERLQMSYLFSAAFQIHAGRFHNILGYWNTAYHHAALFHTTIDRPKFLAFEDNGGILPVHLVGVWLSGTVAASPTDIEYGVMAGNGARIDNDRDRFTFTLDPGNISDPNKNKAVSANLAFKPSIPAGLGLGIFGNFSQVPILDITLPTSLTQQVDQSILGADLFYQNMQNGSSCLELLAEYYRFIDKDSQASTGRFTSSAYYVQSGYHLTERFVPYLRYEQVRIAAGDPYFTALGTTNSNRWVYGLRCSLNPSSAIKAEVRVIDLVGLDRYIEYAAQWAFGF
ncbi:MAG: hypothetical protein HY204_06280 [Nitrospirae bacterium]|nr:hypothetical protein [Nitrospirota bacterium]